MKSFEVNCQIDAPGNVVWDVLTDRAILAGGDFGIIRIEGEIRAGGRIKLWSEVSPKQAFKLKIAGFEPSREMIWQSGMPLGLFKGVRRFTLTPKGAGIDFRMHERFSGPMSGLIVKSIPDLTPSFKKFAAALKRISEERT